MRFFLIVASKNPASQTPLLAQLRALSGEMTRLLPLPGHALPAVDDAPELPLRHDMRASACGGCVVLAWSNDPTPERTQGLIDDRDGDLYIDAGLLHGGASARPGGVPGALRAAASARSIIAELAGAFALARFDGARREMTVSGCLSGCPPVYWCETSDFVAAGVWAPHIALLLSDGAAIRYNPLGLAAFAGHDFFNTGVSGFDGVRLLPPNTLLRLRRGHVEQEAIDGALEEWGLENRPASAADYDEMADALTGFLAAARNTGANLSVALSGGKDSRLVAAGLRAIGASFTLETNGWAEHPDVVLAKRIARLLDATIFHHEPVTEPGYQGVSYDLRRDLLKGIRAMGGLRINRPAAPHRRVWRPARPIGRGAFQLTGTAGEILRGGGASADRPYCARLGGAEASQARVRDVLRSIMAGPHLRWLRPEAEQRHLELVEAEAAALMGAGDPLIALERYDIVINQHRRVYASAALAAIEGGELMPLVDAGLLRLASRLEARCRREHHIHFELLRRLEPRLARWPLAEARWGFEAAGAGGPDPEGHAAREPLKLQQTERAANYVYYALPTNLRTEARRILDEHRGTLAAFMDMGRLEHLLGSPTVLHESTSYWMLNLLGAALIGSDEWRAPPARDPSRPSLVRTDHPHQRLRGWLIHALDMHAVYFEQGRWESDQNALDRYLKNLAQTLTGHRDALQMPLRAWREDIESLVVTGVGGWSGPLSLILSSNGREQLRSRLLGLPRGGATGGVKPLLAAFGAAIYAACGLDPATRCAALRDHDLSRLLTQPVSVALASGGDFRLLQDEASGLNVYGCSPSPRGELSFSSTTASNIGADAHEAAQQAQARWRKRLETASPLDSALAEADEIRAEIAGLVGLGPESAVLLSPSGTDCEFLALAAALARAERVHNILVGSDETGSGVPFAAAGCHFAAASALGAPVVKGELLRGFADGMVSTIDIPLRGPDGAARTGAEIDEAVIDEVGWALAEGRRPLVHVVVSSKTGLAGPTDACVAELRQRHGDSLDIVFDACQLRVGMGAVRAMAARGMVMLTGSKFLGGPPFSAALIAPKAIGEAAAVLLEARPGLADYFTPAELGVRRPAVDAPINTGSLLRWRAGLHEWRSLTAVDLTRAGEIVSQFQRLVDAHVASIAPVAARIPADSGLDAGEPWSRTIAVLALNRADGGSLTLEESRAVYHRLYIDQSSAQSSHRPDAKETQALTAICHVGQPVKCRRTPDGRDWAGTLRLALGAPLMIRLAGMTPARAEKTLDDELATVFLKIRLLIEQLEDARV